MNAQASATREAKFSRVFSQRRAIRLKRLTLPTACSIRARPLYRTFGKKAVSRRCSFDTEWLDKYAGREPLVGWPSRRSLCRQAPPRRNVWADIEQRLEIAAVAGLAAGQMEGDWQAVEIGLEMDFCREAAARTPERLVFLPLLTPLRRHAREQWLNRTSEPDARSGSSRRAPRRRRRKRPTGSIAETFPDAVQLPN